MDELGTSVTAITEIKKRRGAYLPHWTRDAGWYSVTFRLWDSLPRHVVEYWLLERKNMVKTAQQMKRPLSAREEQRLAYLYSEKIERYLDAGHGACYLNDQRVAALVICCLSLDLLRHNIRYDSKIDNDWAAHSLPHV